MLAPEPSQRLDALGPDETHSRGLVVAIFGDLAATDQAVVNRLRHETPSAIALVLDVDRWSRATRREHEEPPGLRGLTASGWRAVSVGPQDPLPAQVARGRASPYAVPRPGSGSRDRPLPLPPDPRGRGAADGRDVVPHAAVVVGHLRRPRRLPRPRCCGSACCSRSAVWSLRSLRVPAAGVVAVAGPARRPGAQPPLGRARSRPWAGCRRWSRCAATSPCSPRPDGPPRSGRRRCRRTSPPSRRSSSASAPSWPSWSRCSSAPSAGCRWPASPSSPR